MDRVIEMSEADKALSDVTVGVTEIVGSATSDVTAEIVGSATSDVTAKIDGIYSDVLVMGGVGSAGSGTEICSDFLIMEGAVESEWDSELIVVHPKTTILQSIVQALRNFLTALGGKFKWNS